MADVPYDILQDDSRRVLKHRRVRRALKREEIRGDWDDLFREPVPAELETPYPLDEAGLARNATIQKKYANRKDNMMRAFNRVQRYMPELMRPGCEPQVVFELSTAHGAILEVARHYGHKVVGNDFANFVLTKEGQSSAITRKLGDTDFERHTDDFGFEIAEIPAEQEWAYRHITESVNIPMKVFDAGALPYPFEDKSVDVTICLQAIEHYCHPDDWADVVAEMCRISRRSIFILLNPMHHKYHEVEGYEEAYHKARLGLRNYCANGFENVATHMHWGKAQGFKLVAR